ncbi:hypothetical protein [Legionella impletisoli]|uniref:Transmembrane protein n=1 Tax=Legionella impletisoli TaxID=343510 RepID=A0A917JXQ7_9GAMM|nr:hypothetical protein [Legionella impletisoli]GGI91705.1 hypothetical protein GCM10007966_20470 [Legionella impletisoli]
MEPLKKIIIIFWAFWWLIAALTDIAGFLSHIDWLTEAWAPDLNYPFLVNSLKMYSVPNWLPPILYAGIIAWSSLIAFLFLQTSMSLFKSKEIWHKKADRAFLLSMTFWFVFFLADQLIMNYDLEQNHMVQGGFQLLTFFCLKWPTNQGLRLASKNTTL